MNSFFCNIFILFIFLYTNVHCRHDVVYLNHTTWLKESKTCIIYGYLNESITLIIEGFNENYSFDWFLYDAEEYTFSKFLKFENEKTLFIQHNSTHTNLTIHDLSWEHAGIYSTFYSKMSIWPIFTLIVDYANENVLFVPRVHYYFQNSDSKKHITCAAFNVQKGDVVFNVCEYFYVYSCGNFKNILNAEVIIEKPNYKNGFVKYIFEYTYAESKTLQCSLPSQNSKSYHGIYVHIGHYYDYFLLKAKNFNIDFKNNDIIEISNENELHLDCIALDEKIRNFRSLQWYINDHLIDKDSLDNGYHIIEERKVILNTKYSISTLIISASLSKNRTNFSCKAQLYSLIYYNHFRNLSIMFKSVVSLSHTAWINNSQNVKIYARPESSVTFLIEGFDDNYLFHWYKFNMDMADPIKLEITKIKSKYYMRNNRSLSLTITDLSSEDTGKYSTFNSEINSSSFIELIVSDVIFINHTQWLKEFRSIQIFRKIGETITLIINGFNEKYSFDWFKYEYKTDELTKLEDEAKYYIENNGNTSNLTITNLSWKDNGKYTTFYSNENKWIIFQLVISNYEPFSVQTFYYYFNTEIIKLVICPVRSNYFKKVKLKIEETNGKFSFLDIEEKVVVPPVRPVSNNSLMNYEEKYFVYPFLESRNVYCTGLRGGRWLDSYPIKVYIGPFPDYFVIVPRNIKSFISSSGIIEAATNKLLKIDCIILYDVLDLDNYIKWFHGYREIIDDDNYKVVRSTQNNSNVIYHYETLEIYPKKQENDETYTCKARIMQRKSITTRNVKIIFKDNFSQLDINSTVSGAGATTLSPNSLLPDQGKTPIWSIIVIIVLVLILLFILLFFIFRILRKRRSQRNIIEFEMTETFNPEIPLQDFVNNLQYDKRLEFSRKKLILGKILGYGHFGIVRKALALGIVKQNVKTPVAVKCVKNPANIEGLRCLISEMKIMVHVGKHLNIVNILGAITKNIAKGNLMIIFEYCAYGNLEDFLRRSRNIFVSQIDPITDEINMENYNDELLNSESATNALHASTSSYIAPNPPKTSFPSTFTSTDHEGPSNSAALSAKQKKADEQNIEHNHTIKPYSILTTTDLLNWAYQITLGMNYISKRNILHGDLAARNILLAENNIVKICDFGLAKTISNQYSHYTKKEEDQLPLKWLAIESLQELKFSIQSDVWSFGVLLWELFSFGCTPYPGVNARGLEFLNMLKKGYRMEKPENANEKIYNIMLSCWESVPTNRAKFSELEEKFANIFSDDTNMQYVKMNEPYEKANTIYNSKPKAGEYLVMLRIPNKIKTEYENIQNKSKDDSSVLTENI